MSKKLGRFCGLVAISSAFGLFSPSHAQQWVLSLDAQPRRIAADGRSTAQVTATVSSAATGPAPDGTEIRFNTTSGQVLPVARTVGGRATAVLTSGSTPNIAQVTAIIGGSSSITEVEFVAGDYQAPDIMLTVEGEIAYSIDRGVLLAADAVIQHADLSIAADVIEFDERRGQVRAQGAVAISNGQASVSADALWYNPEDQAGALLIMGASPQQVGFRAASLSMQKPQPALNLREFEAFEGPETRSWIKAERAVVWPRERIQFTQAEVTVSGRPVLSLPHYFYEYRGTTLNPISQQFRYTAYEGVVLDLPFYFQFQEQRSAGIRLRYAQRGSSYGSFTSPRKGFTLGMEQTYNATGGGGRLFVDSFVSDSRSLEWRHSQDFTRGKRINSSLRYQPKSEFASHALSGNASYYWRLASLDMTAAVYGNRSSPRGIVSSTGSRGSLTTRLDARTRGTPISGTGLSWRASSALVHGPVGSTTTGDLSTGYYQTLGIGIGQRPIRLGLGSTLTLDSTLERTFGARNSNSLRGRATLSRPLGGTGELSLTWDQEFSGGGAISYAYRKSLTASLNAGAPDGIQAFVYYTWIPDEDITTLTATAHKRLAPNLRVELTHDFSGAGFEDEFGSVLTSRFAYTRLSIVRSLGLMDLRFSWSPQGRDYGLRPGQNFWFEIGSRAF